MTLCRRSNPNSPIGPVLDKAEHEGGILLEQEGRQTYALMPLNDDLLDFLLEHKHDSGD